MTQPLIALAPNYTDRSFQRAPVLLNHSLHESPLFTDEGLAALLEQHPDRLTDLNIYKFQPDGHATILTGSRADFTGEQILEAVRRGELWINLRHLNECNPAAAALMAELRQTLASLHPRFKASQLDANLLISAPNAKVPYHADQPDVMLCHIRGAKRIWIYPNDGKHLPDEHFEKVVLKETSEDLPFHRSWDANATVFDLQPGQAVAWPTNAPHRVENLGTMNVSLSIEYMTWGARRRLGAYYINGTQRRLGLRPQQMATIGPAGLAARWALSVPLKRLGLHKGKQKVFETEFELSKDTEEGVRRRG
jgi:hypothetical protein